MRLPPSLEAAHCCSLCRWKLRLRPAQLAEKPVHVGPERGAAAGAEDGGVGHEAHALQAGEGGGRHCAARALVELLENLSESLIVQQVVFHGGI